MEQLDNVAQISEIFGADKKVVDKIKQATITLKELLEKFRNELPPTLKKDNYTNEELYQLAQDIFVKQIKEGL
jgi:hypothetical protein